MLRMWRGSRVRYDICAAVVSDLSSDARVWKELGSLQESGHNIRLIGCRYEIERTERRRENNVDVTEVSLGSRRESSSVRSRARTLFGVWREILRTRARVYHAHNMHVIFPCWLSARARGARLVYDAHELYGNTVRGDRWCRWLAARALLAVEGFAVTVADAVITTNPSRVVALQARHGLRPIEVLANVPRLVEEVVPWDPGFPADVPVLLYQGGIYAAERPFRETIKALRMLEGVHLVILGFGREEHLQLIRTWARELGVADRVHLLPPLPFDRLVSSAAAATVGIVPLSPVDLGYVLGDTNKLHEYLMAGLPVIASDLPEVRRVATQGTPPVGELFDPAEPHTIAEAYRRVVDDPARYAARRREARRIAVEHYHWEIEGVRLCSLYDRLLGTPSGVDCGTTG